jgi:hypothetical protein
MDYTFNVPSFQGKRIQVVNENLYLIRRLRKKGFHLVAENLKISREIPCNVFEGYDLSGFSYDLVCTARYSNYVIRRLPGLGYLLYQGRKS